MRFGEDRLFWCVQRLFLPTLGGCVQILKNLKVARHSAKRILESVQFVT